MTTILKRKYGRSRRLGVSLWGRSKDAFNKRNYPPGQHGMIGYKKLSDFGRQFFTHKKFKFYYAISSKQMRNIFLKAYRKVGDTGDNFVGLLESRLSTVIYHSGIAPTIFAARQLVSHKHVTVNGRIVNICSYVVKPGDIVKIRERSANMNMIISSAQSHDRRSPDYLDIDVDQRSVKYIRIPKCSEVSYAAIMDVNLLIEFYSR